jgi:hypothetical protein
MPSGSRCSAPSAWRPFHEDGTAEPVAGGPAARDLGRVRVRVPCRAVLSRQAQSTSSAQLSLSYVQASDCPPHGRVARTGARGLAEQEGASKQEIIRKVVLERYERSACERRVAGAAARMVARWGDVLDRLGSA